jgi:hypothetical protein
LSAGKNYLAALDDELQANAAKHKASEVIAQIKQNKRGSISVEDELLGSMLEKTRGIKKKMTGMGKHRSRKDSTEIVNIYVIKAALKFRKILHEVKLSCSLHCSLLLPPFAYTRSRPHPPSHISDPRTEEGNTSMVHHRAGF